MSSDAAAKWIHIYNDLMNKKEMEKLLEFGVLDNTVFSFANEEQNGKAVIIERWQENSQHFVSQSTEITRVDVVGKTAYAHGIGKVVVKADPANEIVGKSLAVFEFTDDKFEPGVSKLVRLSIFTDTFEVRSKIFAGKLKA
ncbi:hypothetical protein FISHEDRAFT_70282 [Fistulina hepatica ATCC 64428]|uniref:SnoaL-like domain-containing protein n=1 Tax=Fistulina hepatica ATCC 64428 TaxID=1128425 RepID=A0A0D7AMN5_9AGAR|nr:hypothetical protein FISHEDRAFT_70282 [Fistulina hepatica ATCC 64428]